MRIALVSPLMESVPPVAYGGTERVVASLANALTGAGHHVTVFATSESRVNAELVVCRDRSILTDERPSSPVPDHLLMLDRVRQMADRFDVLHFHTEFLHFPYFEDIAEQTVTTCHSRLDFIGHKEFFRRYHRFPLVSISDTQRTPLPDANWIATVPHGYPLDRYRFLPSSKSSKSRPYLAFLGRINKDKGIDTAIEIALRAGERLKIAARINSFDRPYWEEVIKPKVDGDQIEYVGEINDSEKSRFLGDASALIFPIRWPEPFGLVMIEAMACGTPVVASRWGAVPEVVKDGVTGRIVETVDQAVDAIQEVKGYDRERIRADFEDRYSDQLMARRYLTLYRRLRANRALAKRVSETLKQRLDLSPGSRRHMASPPQTGSEMPIPAPQPDD